MLHRVYTSGYLGSVYTSGYPGTVPGCLGHIRYSGIRVPPRVSAPGTLRYSQEYQGGNPGTPQSIRGVPSALPRVSGYPQAIDFEVPYLTVLDILDKAAEIHQVCRSTLVLPLRK